MSFYSKKFKGFVAFHFSNRSTQLKSMCLIISFLPVSTTHHKPFTATKRDWIISPWATSNSTKKGFFSHEKLLFYENQKKARRRRKELFIAIVCCKRSEKAERATTSSAIVGLLRYVYMRIIWLIMPQLWLWLCEKANEAIWIALNGFFCLHLRHDVLWFSNLSRNPNLLAFYFSSDREKKLLHIFLFIKCFVLSNARLNISAYETVENRHLLLSQERKKSKGIFSEANLRGLSRKNCRNIKNVSFNKLYFSFSDLRL